MGCGLVEPAKGFPTTSISPQKMGTHQSHKGAYPNTGCCHDTDGGGSYTFWVPQVRPFLLLYFILLLGLPSPVSGQAQESSHSVLRPSPGAALLPGGNAQALSTAAAQGKQTVAQDKPQAWLLGLRSLKHPCRLAGVEFDRYPKKIFSRNAAEQEMRIKIILSFSPPALKFPVLLCLCRQSWLARNVGMEVNSSITDKQR